MSNLAEELRAIGHSLDEDLAVVNRGFGDIRTLSQQVLALHTALSVLIDTLAGAEYAKAVTGETHVSDD